jgi:2'-5' RNA ligase
MHRLFIAINIPEDIKQKISQKRDALEQLFPGVRFVSEENWHFTIVFLGYQEDEAIMPIIDAMRAVGPNFIQPEIEISDISYGPPRGTPRMIWLNASEKTSKVIAPFKIALEDELIKNRVRFGLEKRAYNGHITMARLADISKSDLPKLGKEFSALGGSASDGKNLNWSFTAESFYLMESHLANSGAKYEVLQKIDFTPSSI